MSNNSNFNFLGLIGAKSDLSQNSNAKTESGLKLPPGNDIDYFKH